MKLQKFAMAAFALSLTGAIAAGNTQETSKQSAEASAPAGYADKSAAAADTSGQKDTVAAARTPAQGNGSSAAGASSQPQAPAGYADKATPAESEQKDTRASQGDTASASAAGDGSAAAAGGNGSSAPAGDETVRQAQQALQEKGHDPGPIDGQMGPNTQQALQSFQQAQGLQATGQLDTETLGALGIQGNGAPGMSATQGGTASDQPSWKAESAQPQDAQRSSQRAQ